MGQNVYPNETDRAAAAENKGPAKVEALIRVAASTAAAGDHGTAIGLFRRAHELEPYRVEPLVGLGKALAALAHYSEAADAFRQAIKASQHLESKDQSPLLPEAMHGLGNALIAMNQPKAAITQFEEAMKKDERARTYNGIGVAYDMLGQHAAAQAYYRAGLDLNPADLGMKNNLGLSLALTGDFANGIELLRETASNPSATSRYRLNLALAYGLAGDKEAAARVARIDLDEESVKSNLAYYETLRSMSSTKSTMDVIGTHTEVFKVDPDAPKPMPAN
jgi:Flp pilus assembly protein TadD